MTKLPQSPAPAEAATEPAPKPRVPRPDGLTIERSANGLRIVRRWFSPVFIFLLFFCIAWDSFLIFWYAMAFGAAGAGPPFPFSVIMIVFPVAHVAVGVGLTYFTVAGFLNRTVIEADGNELRVRHGPVPWKGNWTLPLDEIDQLYCQDETKKDSDSGTSHNYKLHAVLKDGTRRTLLSYVADADQSRYIEQEIEDFLQIADRPVAGEMRG